MGNGTGLIGNLSDTPQSISVVKEALATFFQDEWLIDSWAMRVPGYDVIGAVQFKQDVFVVVDVRCYPR